MRRRYIVFWDGTHCHSIVKSRRQARKYKDLFGYTSYKMMRVPKHFPPCMFARLLIQDEAGPQ